MPEFPGFPGAKVARRADLPMGPPLSRAIRKTWRPVSKTQRRSPVSQAAKGGRQYGRPNPGLRRTEMNAWLGVVIETNELVVAEAVRISGRMVIASKCPREISG